MPQSRLALVWLQPKDLTHPSVGLLVPPAQTTEHPLTPNVCSSVVSTGPSRELFLVPGVGRRAQSEHGAEGSPSPGLVPARWVGGMHGLKGGLGQGVMPAAAGTPWGAVCLVTHPAETETLVQPKGGEKGETLVILQARVPCPCPLPSWRKLRHIRACSESQI